MSAKNRLLLIRHSIPEMDFSVESSTWELTEDGRRRCIGLAPQVAGYEPSKIYTGPEPKMRQTGEIIGQEIGVPVQVQTGLQEHMRPVLPYRGSDEWHALIARLFANPDDLILGHETGRECLERFESTIVDLARQHEGETFAIVSGATAISLYVEHRTGQEAFEFWQTLAMPDLATVNHPLPP